MDKQFYHVNNCKNYFKNQKSHLKTRDKWVDELFPPNLNSLLAQDSNGNLIDSNEAKRIEAINYDKIEWKRPEEIFGNNCQIFDKIDFNDIKQGSLGNCYFLSSIAALAEFPEFIEHTFKIKTINPQGYYEIVFFIDGEWQIVPIDDYLPVIKGTKKLAFTKANGNELWVLLIEKAWAKINSGYLNIIGGQPTDVFFALTSFPTEYLKNSTLPIDDLWDKILKADIDNDIMCAASITDRNKLEAVGLIPGHAYTIIGAKTAIHNGNKVRLLRIRNPWGSKEWSGDYSDNSSIWDDELSSKFDNYKLDDGCFWMSIEDYINYFDATSFCHILYNENAKSFLIDENSLKSPNIFNLYLSENSRVSLSVFRKHWRYNREFRYKNQPISIVISKYDSEFYFSNVNGSYNSLDNVSITTDLESGHYVIWVYYNQEISDSPKLNQLVIRATSKADFTIINKTQDTELLLIREIIASESRQIFAKDMEEKPGFVKIQNCFKNTGLAYIFVSNGAKNKMNVNLDFNRVNNFTILNPHFNEKKVEIGVNPGGVYVIPSIRNVTYGSYGFTVNFSNKPSNPDGVGEKMLGDISHYLSNLTTVRTDYDFSFTNSKNPNIQNNNDDILTSELSKKYPYIMNKLLKLPKVVNDDELGWRFLKWPNEFYVGQVDNDNQIEGRGCLVKNDKSQYYCQWVNGKKSGLGWLYDKRLKLAYEGNFENDLFNGKGKLYYTSGENYNGLFKDGMLSGKGIFTFNNGDSWNGTFKQNRFYGSGVYTEKNGNKRTEDFSKNAPVEISSLENIMTQT